MVDRLMVAIPCYNCAEQLPRVLNGFSSRTLERITRVVIIDNRSRDNTLEIARRLVAERGDPRFEVIQNNENYGLGGSLKVAFLYGQKIGADYVAILHGDNQATTSELEDLIAYADDHPELAAVLGSRFMKGSRLRGYSMIRTWGNRALNLLYSLLTLRSIKDLGSGLNLHRLDALSDQAFKGFPDGFTFDMQKLLYYVKHGKSFRFIPITWTEADQVSNAKTFQVGWQVLMVLLNWRFGRSKVQQTKDYSFTSVQQTTTLRFSERNSL